MIYQHSPQLTHNFYWHEEFVDLKKLSGKYQIKVFSEPFVDEEDAINQLKEFEALLIMRERTKISENLINNRIP